VLDKTDETIDEQMFSRCSFAVRVHQILCKQQVCGLLSDVKESAESTHTIEESCALIVGTGHGGKNYFNVACIQEWGAATLRAVLIAERIKQKYVMINVSENGHDYAQINIADRDAMATEAAAEAKSAATLHKVTISMCRDVVCVPCIVYVCFVYIYVDLELSTTLKYVYSCRIEVLFEDLARA